MGHLLGTGPVLDTAGGSKMKASLSPGRGTLSQVGIVRDNKVALCQTHTKTVGTQRRENQGELPSHLMVSGSTQNPHDHVSLHLFV